MHSMRRIHALTAIASLALLGTSACGDPPPAFPQGDFGELALRRYPALGFCVEQGMVLEGVIRPNDDDGTATFSGEWAAAGDPETDDCESGPDFCLIRAPFGPQTLSAEQVADLQAAIAAVDRKECDDGDIQCDPCMITELSVNGRGINDTCCGSVNGGFSGPFDALAAQIDRLADRAAR